ncbi:ligand-binding protein SH3 [Nocardioides silvaticus]|uniref:Ligand-binding protein SH3 n=1 Tax=Nocardioides silvaticus TaxID=2201891 RepID=A0A316TH85_9ACTN|nr:multidrug efflux SMR transporter [Nocardioides silvaticus]PWN02871.1 ligand-binding protein SH3 [Nocardioides silvaticus]
MLAAFGLLLVAIALEVAATSALPRTEGFRDLGWSGFVIVGYAASIWLLAVVVEKMAVSTAYAIWSGLGTASVAVIGALWLGESADPLKIAAITMIVVGVVLLNLHGAH